MSFSKWKQYFINFFTSLQFLIHITKKIKCKKCVINKELILYTLTGLKKIIN
jgi:hypothetical protein